MIDERILPIGTVCTLEGAQNDIMIIGYLPISEDEKNIYDYMGCMYPYGALDTNKFFVFNYDQINKVKYLGFYSESYKNLEEQINNSLINKNKETILDEVAKIKKNNIQQFNTNDIDILGTDDI